VFYDGKKEKHALAIERDAPVSETGSVFSHTRNLKDRAYRRVNNAAVSADRVTQVTPGYTKERPGYPNALACPNFRLKHLLRPKTRFFPYFVRNTGATE
jgi:hypothetical protein